MNCAQLELWVESSVGAHALGRLVPVCWSTCCEGGSFPVPFAHPALCSTPPALPPLGALGRRAARELHAQATKDAFHDSVPLSNALNLPPRRVLVPSAALDQRADRYSSNPGARGKQRPREGRGGDGAEKCGLAAGQGRIHRAEIKSWVAVGSDPGGDLFFSETDACVP